MNVYTGEGSESKFESNLSALDTHAQNPDSYFLNFRYEGITKIFASTLHQYKLLKFIDLSDNLLLALPNDLFRCCPQLTEVRLNGNNLINLPLDIFKYNNKIQVIHLHENELRKLWKDIFGDLPDLREVWLFDNEIQGIDGNIFQHNKKLKVIKLYSNYIKEIHEDTFKNLPELETLNLDDNQIQQFNFENLSDSTKLKHLGLNVNFLTEIPGYDQLRTCFPALTHCDLSDNKLRCSYLKSVLDSFIEQGITMEGLDKDLDVKSYSVYGIKCQSDTDYMCNRIKQLEETVEMLHRDIQVQKDEFLKEMKMHQKELIKEILSVETVKSTDIKTSESQATEKRPAPEVKVRIKKRKTRRRIAGNIK